MAIRPLTKELAEKALNELNEVPDRLEEDIQHIYQWLAKQPHLKFRPDNQWLVSFLRSCKFSLQRTKEKLDMYYTLRTITPEFFNSRDPFLPEIQEVLKLGSCLPLPKIAGPSAPRIILIRNGITDVEKTNIMDVFKTHLMILDILIYEDDFSIVAGQHVLQDMKNMSVGHMLQMNPGLAKKMSTCIQNAYPTRTKGIHFINIPSFFEKLYGMVKVFLNDKMKSRVNVYIGTDYEELYKVIPKTVLPLEYGGEGDKLDNIIGEWKRKVESYRDWFIEDDNYGTDESKRPGKPKTVDDVFGLEGSFRTLNVD